VNDRMERRDGAPGDDAESVAVVRDLSGADVEDIAAAFAGIWQQALLTAVLRSGRLLLERVYGGDEELFHRPGPKDSSLPRVSDALAERGLSVSAAQLRRTVHRALLLEQLGTVADVRSFRHIRPSHLDEVASLPRGRRVELLLRSERQRLSVAQLRRLCSMDRAPTLSGGTAGSARELPCPRPTHVRARRLEAALDDVRRHESRLERVLGELARVGVLDRATRIEILGVALRLKRQIESLESKLARVLRQ